MEQIPYNFRIVGVSEAIIGTTDRLAEGRSMVINNCFMQHNSGTELQACISW